MPERHPGALLLSDLDAAASRLITMVGGMVREAPSLQDPQLVLRLHRAEADLLQAMAGRLELWEQQIRQRRGWPQPPSAELQLPRSWSELGADLNDPRVNRASLERLERIASRLQLCRQAAQAIRDGESSWRAILNGS